MGTSLAQIIRNLISLLDRRQRRRFAMLGVLSATNALLEAAAALFVLALVAGITTESGRPSGTDPVRSLVRWGMGDGASARAVTVAVALSTLVFYVVKNVSAVIENYLQQRLVHQAAADASTAIVAAYLRVPMDFHYVQRSGDVLRNSWNATELVYRTSLLAAVYLASEMLAATALLVVLVAAAPAVTPVVIATLLLVVVLMYRALKPRMTAWGHELQELSSTSLQGIQEAFGAVRDARILAREEYFVERYRGRRAQLARSYWKSGTATNAPRFAIETAFIVTMVVTVILLTSQERTGPETVSLMGLYGYAGLRLMPSANRALMALGNLRLGENAVELVREALNVPQEQAAQADAPDLLPFEQRIVVDHVTYQFATAEVPALHDVSLVVRSGESIGIVGPSGGGKSTLIDVIVGLLQPQGGRVHVDEVDISQNLSGWRRQIGYVSQTVFLLDDTLRANVAFGVEPDAVDEALLWEALSHAQLADFVRTLPEGLATTLGERGVRLSGGQRQRVAIARALYHRPSLLVFDEATAALDTKTEEGLTAAVEALARTRTVLIVAHRLSTVRACDRLVLMEHGRVSDIGTFEELQERSGSFRELVAAGRV